MRIINLRKHISSVPDPSDNHNVQASASLVRQCHLLVFVNAGLLFLLHHLLEYFAATPPASTKRSISLFITYALRPHQPHLLGNITI